MIQSWRDNFQHPNLWFGFVQIAGFAYSAPYGNPPRAEVSHSRAAGDWVLLTSAFFSPRHDWAAPDANQIGCRCLRLDGITLKHLNDGTQNRPDDATRKHPDGITQEHPDDVTQKHRPVICDNRNWLLWHWTMSA
jgi:hypothetical protein